MVTDFVNNLCMLCGALPIPSQYSHAQIEFLKFVLQGLLITNSLSWAAFEAYSLKERTCAALSWSFRKSEIDWDSLLHASIQHTINLYAITEVTLVIDDTDNSRSKNTSEISGVHKIKDKKTGGFMMGQEIVTLIMVSKNGVTAPAFSDFYMPDPLVTEWHQNEKRRKKTKMETAKEEKKVPKPESRPEYPTKGQIAQNLIAKFKEQFPSIKVRAILADCAYGHRPFVSAATEIYPEAQLVSQLSKSCIVLEANEEISLAECFKNKEATTLNINLRYQEKTIHYVAKTLAVRSHDKQKRMIIAMKYEGETEYRYLMATVTSWLPETIIKEYALRWLVEVFIQDWKGQSGWFQLSKQQGEAAAKQGLILSLLCDHMILSHHDQIAAHKNKQLALTAGSIREQLIAESLYEFISEIVLSENPHERLAIVAEKIKQHFKLKNSLRHIRELEVERVVLQRKTETVKKALNKIIREAQKAEAKALPRETN